MLFRLSSFFCESLLFVYSGREIKNKEKANQYNKIEWKESSTNKYEYKTKNTKEHHDRLTGVLSYEKRVHFVDTYWLCIERTHTIFFPFLSFFLLFILSVNAFFCIIIRRTIE